MAMLSLFEAPTISGRIREKFLTLSSFFSKTNKISILIRTPAARVHKTRNRKRFKEVLRTGEILCTPGMLFMLFFKIKEFRTINENNFNFILFSGRIASKRIGEEEKFRSATTTDPGIDFQVIFWLRLSLIAWPEEIKTKQRRST